MTRLFGTDGVRGVANTELTPELVYRLGQAGAYVLTSETKRNPRILVGMDTRVSGCMLESALVAGICSVGAEAVCLDIVPTPAVAYLTRYYEADAGVVISASHNSFEFNGVKFFDSRGYKLPDETEDSIEALVRKGLDGALLPSGAGVGRRRNASNALRDYVDFLKSTIDNDLTGLKIAVDCANGASYQAAPILFEELGAQVFTINNCPDGLNINRNCGSTHMSRLQEFVRECGADIGLAFDGDADRVLAVDENGELVDGDRILAIIGLEMKKNGQLAHDTIVVTVMSNIGFDIMAREKGLRLVRTKVGDRYVLEEMLDKGYTLGGEQSGHIILLEHNTTGDGLLTALQLLNVMKSTGSKLTELAGVMQVLPQVLKNAKVRNENKHRYMEDELVARLCCELEDEFRGEGRVLIRPSGTKPLEHIMIAGKDNEYTTKRDAGLAAMIEKRLG